MMDDIGPILKNWDYNADDLNVRIINGVDGQPKLQMRLDLGLLQLELDGRPDGQRPHRCDSYLTFYEKKAERHAESKREKPFRLSPLDCLKLQQEAIQYYHRYLALMKLKDYPRVVRDTSRNLRVFDLVAKFADNEEIAWSFEQYRAYVIMMNTRAHVSICLEKKEFDSALQFIADGIEKLKNFYQTYAERLDNNDYELEFLQQWAQEIIAKRPLSLGERLHQELAEAVRIENYEKAALLRDQIAELQKKEKNFTP